MSQQVIISDNVYIPQEMFNYVVQTIKQSKNQKLFEFKYSDLLKYSWNYDYQKAEQFRINLAKYSERGSYYILLVDYSLSQYIDNLSNIIDIQQIQKIYKSMFNIMGITKYGFVAKNQTDKNCLSVLNKTLLKLDDWIGTLQHQMTHFIQRVIGLEQTIQKKYHNEINKSDQNLNPKIIRFAQILSKYTKLDQVFTNAIIKKYTYMFAKNEIQQTLKSVLLMFKNIYQRQIIYKNGNICSIKIKNESIEERLNWLNNYLLLINSKQYWQSQQFHKLIMIWRKKSILCNQQELINHRYISYILCYLGIKNILPEIDIDNKLKTYFEEF